MISTFQTMYYKLKASMSSKSVAAAAPSSSSTRFPPVPLVQPAASLRLPEITIKEFSGQFEEWESFCDIFTSLIHSNCQLTHVQKFYYLRASVTGEAARMIAPLELTSNNYLLAWKMLKDRFENKPMLIKRHMARLLLIAPLKKESGSELLDLADEFDRHVQLLDKLEDAADHWNSFLVERLSSYLDPTSLREWETQTAGEIKPTYKQILEFIHKRSRILQTLTLSQPKPTPQTEHKFNRVYSAHVSTLPSLQCACCQQPHLLFQCNDFLSLTPLERFDMVKRFGLCINCMKGTHLVKDCFSGTCKTCGRKHHSLLHLSSPSPSNNKRLPKHVQQSSVVNVNSVPIPLHGLAEASQSVHYPNVSSRAPSGGASSYSVNLNPSPASVNHFQMSQQKTKSTVLLSTAIIKVLGADNKYQYARALLDSGSQPSFVSEELCQRLNIKPKQLNSPVSCIGQSTINVRNGVSLLIASRYGNFKSNLDCFVLPKLTDALPSCHIDVRHWRIPQHLPLADPQFNISQGVDIIIGAELFYSLLENQQITLETGYPILQKTIFGYIVCGKVPEQAKFQSVVSSNLCIEQSTSFHLQRLWQKENINDGKTHTPDGQFIVNHFQYAVPSDDDGRHIIR